MRIVQVAVNKSFQGQMKAKVTRIRKETRISIDDFVINKSILYCKRGWLDVNR